MKVLSPFFKDNIRKAVVIKELSSFGKSFAYEMLEGYLRAQGLEARGGQIIAANLEPVP